MQRKKAISHDRTLAAVREVAGHIEPLVSQRRVVLIGLLRSRTAEAFQRRFIFRLDSDIVRL